MKNVLIYLFLVLVFLSCTKKYCQENYPCPPDSIKTIKLIDIDTSWFQMPADTEYVEIPINCPDQEATIKDNKKETKVKIKDKKLSIQTTSKADSSLILTLRNQLYHYERIIKEKPTPVIIYKNPWYFKYILYTFAILLVFNIIRFRKTLFSFFRRVRF